MRWNARSKVASSLSALSLVLLAGGTLGGCAGGGGGGSSGRNASHQRTYPFVITASPASPNGGLLAGNANAVRTQRPETDDVGEVMRAGAGTTNLGTRFHPVLAGESLLASGQHAMADSAGPDLRPTHLEPGTTDEGTTNISKVTFAEEGSDFDPSLSRDGLLLAYASTQHRATSDIYVKQVGTRVTTRLTNDPAQDMMPRVSPDGSMIAFASDREGNWDIFIMPVTGGKAVRVTQGPEHEIAPSWSPDGSQLVYCKMGQASERWEMWISKLEAPDSASFIGYGLFPQWSPRAATGKDGADRVLFQLGRERGRKTFGVWTMDVSNGRASNATEIVSDAHAALINPCWSPDGAWIIYAHVPVDGVSSNGSKQANAKGAHGLDASLYMVSAEGEGQTRLTTGIGSALSPAWTAPDRVYFVSNRDGADNIWSIDLAQAMATAHAATQPGQASLAAKLEGEGASERATAGEAE